MQVAFWLSPSCSCIRNTPVTRSPRIHMRMRICAHSFSRAEQRKRGFPLQPKKPPRIRHCRWSGQGFVSALDHVCLRVQLRSRAPMLANHKRYLQSIVPSVVHICAILALFLKLLLSLYLDSNLTTTPRVCTLVLLVLLAVVFTLSSIN